VSHANAKRKLGGGAKEQTTPTKKRNVHAGMRKFKSLLRKKAKIINKKKTWQGGLEHENEN